MRILVTGAGGFLGGAIISRLLDSGIQVRAIGRTDKKDLLVKRLGSKAEEIEWRSVDITATRDVIDAADGCDSVVHLAGQLTPYCQEHPVAGAMTNVIGTLNIFEAAKSHGIGRVVYCSSGGVFGMEDNRVPFPLTHYGAFKLANEGSARAYWQDHGIASIGFRPFVVYGPGRETGLSAGPTLACRAAALGEPYTIPLTGSIGLVYIDDVARSFCIAVQTFFEGAHILNLPGEPVKIDEVITHIQAIVPDAKLDCRGEPLPMVATAQNDYENRFFDVAPATEVQKGLRMTVEYYRKQTVAEP